MATADGVVVVVVVAVLDVVAVIIIACVCVIVVIDAGVIVVNGLYFTVILIDSHVGVVVRGGRVLGVGDTAGAAIGARMLVLIVVTLRRTNRYHRVS